MLTSLLFLATVVDVSVLEVAQESVGLEKLTENQISPDVELEKFAEPLLGTVISPDGQYFAEVAPVVILLVVEQTAELLIVGLSPGGPQPVELQPVVQQLLQQQHVVLQHAELLPHGEQQLLGEGPDGARFVATDEPGQVTEGVVPEWEVPVEGVDDLVVAEQLAKQVQVVLNEDETPALVVAAAVVELECVEA